jgi:hypothetical protein
MTAKARQAPALPPERASFGRAHWHFFYMLYAGLMTALGWIAEPLQRWISMKRMAYFFVLPNLLIFGIFVLFPMLLNIYYSFTGGTALFPQNRPFVGAQNYQQIFTCANFLDPNSCREDRFWRGLYNTVFLRDLPGGRHGRTLDAHRRGAQPLDRRARLLPQRLLLPGAALARGGRVDLEVDSCSATG